MSTVADQEVLTLETRGFCLSCLKDCLPSSSDNDGNGEEKKCTAASLKLFLRYLKIDVLKLETFSSGFLPSSGSSGTGTEPEGNVDVVVTLCEGCGSVGGRFLSLYQQWENIRLQMDECVREMYDNMTTGDGMEDRVTEFRKRMETRKPMELVNASIVDKLRKETIRKCSLTVDVSPRGVALHEEQASNNTGHTAGADPREGSARTSSGGGGRNQSSRIKIVSVSGAGNATTSTNPATNTATVEDSPGFELIDGDENLIEIKHEDSSASDYPASHSTPDTPPPSLVSSQSQDSNEMEVDDGQLPQLSPTFLLSVSPSSSSRSSSSNQGSTPKRTRGLVRRRKSCQFCGIRIPKSANTEVHEKLVHTLEAFPGRCSPNTTKEQVRLAIDNVLNTNLRKHDWKKVKICCHYCPEKVDTLNILKCHILEEHMDLVVASLAKVKGGSKD